MNLSVPQRLRSGSPLCMLLLGLLLLGCRPPDATAQDPGKYAALVAEGDRKAAAGDAAGAWTSYVQARDNDPSRKGVYVRLAMTALDLKKRQEGLEALDAFLRLEPDALDDKDIALLQRNLRALPAAGSPTATAAPTPAASQAPSPNPSTKPRGGLLEAASADAALNEAASAWQSGDRTRARQLGQEALEALLPALRQPQEAALEVWRAAARTALLLEDHALGATTQAAIEKQEPQYTSDGGLLKLMADLNRLPNKPLLEEARRDVWAFAQTMLVRPRAGAPFINSLGMKFAPVIGTSVLFSVWETRVQDFEAFVKETGHDATEGMYSLGSDGWKQRGHTWKDPGFPQTRTHPVVGVNWNDAQAFCRWLSKKEGRTYRLPTDLEWSAAVGLPPENGKTPEERDAKVEGVYPWGSSFPPTSGAGNYAGSEARDGQWPTDLNIIESFRDGFARTAPVGSFSPNRHGLCDLGGNVWEWCEDKYKASQEWRVLRGGSWYSNSPRSLLSSFRIIGDPGDRDVHYGFRLVVVVESR